MAARGDGRSRRRREPDQAERRDRVTEHDFPANLRQNLRKMMGLI
jgi:hypothetical protein